MLLTRRQHLGRLCAVYTVKVQLLRQLKSIGLGAKGLKLAGSACVSSPNNMTHKTTASRSRDVTGKALTHDGSADVRVETATW